MESGGLSGMSTIVILAIAGALIFGLALHARRHGDITSRPALMAIAAIIGVIVLAIFALGPLGLL